MWLTGLDLAGWLAGTHTHTQLACTHTVHHVSMWKQTTMYTCVYKYVTYCMDYTLKDNLWSVFSRAFCHIFVFIRLFDSSEADRKFWAQRKRYDMQQRYLLGWNLTSDVQVLWNAQ